MENDFLELRRTGFRAQSLYGLFEKKLRNEDKLQKEISMNKKTVAIAFVLLTVVAGGVVFAVSHYEIKDILGLKLQTGTYKANISREDSNLYLIHEIGGRRVEKCYIRTKYCYEYGRRVDVIIEITNPNSSSSIGTIYF
jgi:hypothetical protein